MGKRILSKKAIILLGIALIIMIVWALQLLISQLRGYEAPRLSTVCMNCLGQIGVALHMYAQDYDGYFPSSEEEFMNLYPKYVGNDPRVFWCPEDSDPKPTKITSAISNGINSCQVSYRYYPGFKKGDSPGTILVEDNSIQNHKGRGINRLYLAGYVKWMEKKNLESAISIKKRLVLEIQKIKDKGEPITVEDLFSKKISDGENGALVYKEAFAIKENLEKKYEKEWYYLPYEGAVSWGEVPKQQKQKVRILIFSNSDSIKMYHLFEKASNMECQFIQRNDYEDYEKGAVVLLPYLANLRSCARLLAAKAKLEAESGDIGNALTTCLIGLKVAKSLSNEPVLIPQLVRIAVGALAIENIEEILKKGELSNIEIYQNIIRTIEEERKDKITYFSLIGERIISGRQNYAQRRKTGESFFEFTEEDRKEIEDAYHRIDNGKFKEKLKSDMEANLKEYKKKIKNAYLKSGCKNIKEFLDQQELFYLNIMGNAISLVKKPYWEARGKLAKLDKEIKDAPEEKAILTQIPEERNFSKLYTQEARMDAQFGAAEIALACHIYKIKYGDYPLSLEKLVPGVLLSLPLDPFTGEDYIYKRKGEGFIVYSLGDNCKDDGGKWGTSHKWGGDFDIVFDIAK